MSMAEDSLSQHRPVEQQFRLFDRRELELPNVGRIGKLER